MKIGLTSIQRDRARWLTEWVIFHHLIGVSKFYIYLHRCTDNSTDKILELQQFFDIQCFVVPDETFRPQLASYQHAYQEFGHQVDWMGFIDGDEFLYPTNNSTIPAALDLFQYEKMSALGVWWACYGSGGHQVEPQGYVIENYKSRPRLDIDYNSHIKCLVRGHQGSSFSVGPNAHIFNTILGTKDENLRDIQAGYIPSIKPTYNHLRINHYVCQSYEYFKKFKQNSGAADAGALAVRPDEWWIKHDINEYHDTDILKFLPKLKQTVSELNLKV